VRKITGNDGTSGSPETFLEKKLPHWQDSGHRMKKNEASESRDGSYVLFDGMEFFMPA